MTWRDFITVDPAVCHGAACISGTRIPVSVVLDNLATGMTIETLRASYPSLTAEAVRAALGYAADLASERLIAVPS